MHQEGNRSLKANLESWARIAEIGTAIVVVVSLIYIAIELDQNTRATHTASWEAVIDLMATLDVTEATELGRFIEEAEKDPASVTEEEYWKFSRMAQARLGVMEYAFLGVRTETLSEYHWGAISGFLELTICKPGYLMLWSDIGEQMYHPDFVKYVREIISDCESTDPADA